jgi:VanZ family protein
MGSSFSDTLLKRGTLFMAGCGYLIIALCSLVPGEYRPHIDGLSGKEEHALAYLVLGMLTVIAARRTVNLYRLCLIMVAYAGILEFLQLFAPCRHAAVGDFMASSFGAMIGITLTALALRRVPRIEAILAPSPSPDLPRRSSKPDHHIRPQD